MRCGEGLGLIVYPRLELVGMVQWGWYSGDGTEVIYSTWSFAGQTA